MRFIDTNIFIRLLTRDNEAMAKACLELFRRVELGQETITTNEAVISEVVFVLASPKLYKLSHVEIGNLLLPLLTLPHFQLAEKQMYLRAFEIYAAHNPLSFTDALNVAYVEHLGLGEITSYDRGFDRVPGVRRIEP